MSLERNLVQTEDGYWVFQPLPTELELNQYYSEEYYQNPHGTYQEEYSAEETFHRETRLRLLKDFIIANVSHISLDAPRFLDIGCGEGFALSYFNRLGWQVKGLDFSIHGVSKQNPSMIEKVTQGDLFHSIRTLGHSADRFDVVLLGNVLEHVVSPAELIQDVSHILSDHGVLCITVPNDFSMLQKLLYDQKKIHEKYWIAYPDHLNYFTLQSLRTFLTNQNMAVIDYYCDFPIEWYLTNRHSNYVLDPNLGKSAHLSRVFLDSQINNSENRETVMCFWRCLSELGFGRSITTISRKNPTQSPDHQLE